MTPERVLRFHPRTDMWKGLWINWGWIHRLGFFGFRLHPSPGSFVTPTAVLFHGFLVAENIYSKTGIEKNCTENLLLRPGPLPQATLPAIGRALSLGCPLTSPASLFQSKGYQWKQQNLQGMKRSLAPATPHSPPVPTGAVGQRPKGMEDICSLPPQGTREALAIPGIQA